MKEIKAIIQEFMLPKVVEALRTHPEFPGLTVSRVRGFGRHGTGLPGAAQEMRGGT